MTPEKALLVMLGGAGGSLARYAVAVASAHLFGSAFPWGTLGVNVAGSFLIGLVATLADEYDALGANTRVLLVVGVFGGFTTFSSLSMETFRLAEDGFYFRAGAYIAATAALGAIAVLAGVAVARAAQ